MLDIEDTIAFNLTAQKIIELVIKAAREEGYKLNDEEFTFHLDEYFGPIVGGRGSKSYKLGTTKLLLTKIKPHDGRGIG